MAEFKPRTWAQPVQDIVKEYEQYEKDEQHVEVQTEPEAISKSMVRRGIMDPDTGALTGNSKSHKITRDNANGYSAQGKLNYERIFGHP